MAATCAQGSSWHGPTDPERALIVIRHGETFLKGGNRHQFESLLIRNIRRALSPIAEPAIERAQGRCFVWIDKSRKDEATGRLAGVFGISSLSPAEAVPADIDVISREAVRLTRELAEQKPVRSFKVATKRSDKRFPITSIEISRRVGAAIVTELNLPVDVHKPQTVIGIEIGQQQCFVYARRIEGAGGLPVGASGKALLLLSGGIDSPVAGHLMQKRGCELGAVYFHSPPHTSEHARDKVEQLAERLARSQERVPLHVVPFADVQQTIYDHAPAELLVVLYRRAMMRIAERLARTHGCAALVTGENLGQVASQTLGNLHCIEAATELPVLRPLLTYDKQETIALARRIGTFDTSIQPYADCCSLFVPKHPATRVRPDRATQVESQLGLAALIERATADARTVNIHAF